MNKKEIYGAFPMESKEIIEFGANVRKNELLDYLKKHSENHDFKAGEDVVIFDPEDDNPFKIGVVAQGKPEDNNKIPIGLDGGTIMDIDKNKIFLLEDFQKANSSIKS